MGSVGERGKEATPALVGGASSGGGEQDSLVPLAISMIN